MTHKKVEAGQYHRPASIVLGSAFDWSTPARPSRNRGPHLETQFLLQVPRDKASHAVRLPVGSFHDRFQGRPLRPLQQCNDPRPFSSDRRLGWTAASAPSCGQPVSSSPQRAPVRRQPVRTLDWPSRSGDGTPRLVNRSTGSTPVSRSDPNQPRRGPLLGQARLVPAGCRILPFRLRSGQSARRIRRR